MVTPSEDDAFANLGGVDSPPEELSAADMGFMTKALPALLFLPAFPIVYFALTGAARATGKGSVGLTALPLVFLAPVILLILFSGYRRVWLAGENLLIADKGGQVAVPLAQIADVQEQWWVHFGTRHPIVIEFSDPTAAGRKVTFLPASFGSWGSARPGTPHPLCQVLKDRAWRSRYPR